MWLTTTITRGPRGKEEAGMLMRLLDYSLSKEINTWESSVFAKLPFLAKAYLGCLAWKIISQPQLLFLKNFAR